MVKKKEMRDCCYQHTAIWGVILQYFGSCPSLPSVLPMIIYLAVALQAAQDDKPPVSGLTGTQHCCQCQSEGLIPTAAEETFNPDYPPASALAMVRMLLSGSLHLPRDDLAIIRLLYPYQGQPLDSWSFCPPDHG